MRGEGDGHVDEEVQGGCYIEGIGNGSVKHRGKWSCWGETQEEVEVLGWNTGGSGGVTV